MISSPSTATAGVSAIKILLLSTTASSSAISSMVIVIGTTVGRVSSTRVGWSSGVIWARRTSHTSSRGHSRCKHSLVGNLSWHHLLTHLRMETWPWSCLGVHHGTSSAWTRRWVVTWITTWGNTAKSWLRHVLRWLLLLLLLLLLTSFGSLTRCWRRSFPSAFLLSWWLWATLLRRWHSAVRCPRILLRHVHGHWHHPLHWWSSWNELRSAHHMTRHMRRSRCSRGRGCKCFCTRVERERLRIGIEFCTFWFSFFLIFFFVALFFLLSGTFRIFLCSSILVIKVQLELRNVGSDRCSLGFFRRSSSSSTLSSRQFRPTRRGGSCLLPRLLFPCSLIFTRFVQNTRI
mmetsp:Transcript_849/g.1346  ORF Transcript_849/g.1346 Transcript_849/m.1346 type:complete len:346 (+) Transcript_849:164-1201(+)